MRLNVLALLGPLLTLCGVSSNSLEADPSDSDDCEIARAKCTYRASCARALHSYMVDCADVFAGRTKRCPWACKRALISLTSSEAGYQLSSCDCGNSEFCQKSKILVEVCREEVTWATAGDTVVPCSVAQWICHADPLCSTALGYYHRLCRSMFHGRKCTPRCNNSLAILDRQEKASKLRNCYCEGTEDFPCQTIRENTQRLCFGREDWVESFPAAPSTSDASSGTRGSPQNDVLVLLVFVLSALAFLNKDRGPAPSTPYSRDFLKRTEHECMAEVKRSWPWWWTSEAAS